MSQPGTMKVIGMSGSLRKGSYNSAALRAAGELLPDGMTLETVDLGDIPPYNDDVRLQAYPAVVQNLRERVAAADAVLFSTPEYNYGPSGVLKNAIDWLSRPPEQPLNWKVCGMMSASGGLLGGVRAQYQLRHMLVSTNSFAVNQPQVFITEAAKKFDADLKLTDQSTRDFIKQMLIELRSLVLRFKAGAPA